MRPYRLHALVAVFVGLTAGCSSSPPARHATQASRAKVHELREGDAVALIYQCALTRGLVTPPDAAQQQVPRGAPLFVQGSKVVITTSNYDSWVHWTARNGALVLDHALLDDWALGAADNDKLPATVCGRVTAAALQKQVFAKYPAAGDPWES
jgi:hypothetical protein